jgi:tetratricopeptide (TPR) repeat protein
MRKINYTYFLFLVSIISLSSFAQSNEKYKEIDTLLKTNSMIDAMTALNKLKSDYQKDTADAEYWLRYSQGSYTFYKYEDAKKAINKAITLSPKTASYQFEKGLLLNRVGELDSASTELDKAIQLSPEGEYYYWKGIVEQQLGKMTDAETAYLKAIDHNYETAEMHNNLAILLMGNKNPEQSLTHVNKAIAMKSDYAQAYSARSKIYLYLLNVDSACVDKNKAYDLGFRKMLEIPDSVCKGSFKQKMQFAAEVCATTGFYDQAIKAYTALIDKGIKQGDYLLNRGYCYYLTKKYPLAEQDYLNAFNYKEVNKDLLYDNISLLYYEQGNYKEAILMITDRISLNPNNHVPYIDRGLCYRKMKKYKEAEKDFNMSLSIKPDFFRAFGYRSFLFLELGQNEKAYEDATQAVKYNSKYGYGYLVLAQAKYKLGIKDFCMDLYSAQKYGDPEADAAIKELCK